VYQVGKEIKNLVKWTELKCVLETTETVGIVQAAERGASVDCCLARFNVDEILYQPFNLIFITLKVVEFLA